MIPLFARAAAGLLAKPAMQKALQIGGKAATKGKQVAGFALTKKDIANLKGKVRWYKVLKQKYGPTHPRTVRARQEMRMQLKQLSKDKTSRKILSAVLAEAGLDSLVNSVTSDE